MNLYLVPTFGTSTRQLTLTIFALLLTAPLSLHAEDEPQGDWITTNKRVNVRCPDGHVAGVIDPRIVRVVGAGDEGRLMVQGLSLKDDSCAEHYIAAQYLRPLEVAFWKLDHKRWRHGLDVGGIH